jgi:hypothetical protein
MVARLLYRYFGDPLTESEHIRMEQLRMEARPLAEYNFKIIIHLLRADALGTRKQTLCSEKRLVFSGRTIGLGTFGGLECANRSYIKAAISVFCLGVPTSCAI